MEAVALLQRERVISWSRLAVVAAAIAAMFFEPWLAAAAVAAFVVLLFVHERAIRRRKRAERAARFHEEALHRIAETWTGRGVAGDAYLPAHHLYASDLDLFGKGSIYEFLCTATTGAGRARLAEWLLQPLRDAAAIRARQDAARELGLAVDLREEIACAGDDIAHELDLGRLREWSAMEPLLTKGRAAALALGALATLAFIATLPSLIAKMVGMTHPEAAASLGRFADFPVWPLIVAIVIEALFARSLATRVNAVIGSVERAEQSLAQLARLLGTVEGATFQSAALVALQERLRTNGRNASEEIDRLRRLTALLDSRRNQFFAPFAALMLWTTNIAFGVERWRATSGHAIGSWIDAVAELEALASLGALAWEQPSYSVPEITSDAPRFDAVALGHPLIASSKRIANDIRLGDGLQLLLVSGSNMSGKSTMMRSVGVATVLALAGAPVCASSLRISPMRVGASIRIGDSLLEGASKFYAEILRIRDVLNAAAEGPLLFLLDEVLAGTNSHDRRIGAEAIVRALVERQAIGIVSTHDLALAKVVDSLTPRAKNVHFEDHLEDGKVVFDYRMREGVVQKSNAVELMRSVGIEI